MEDDSTDCTRIIQVVTASYFISYWVLVFADSTGAIDLFVRIPLPPVDLVLTSASVSLTLPAAIHLAWRSGAAGGALTGLFGAFGGIGILSMPRTLVAFGPGWQLPLLAFDAAAVGLIVRSFQNERRYGRPLPATELALLALLAFPAFRAILGA